MGELSWVDSSNEWEQADLSIPGSADNHTLQIWSKRWTKRMGELGRRAMGKVSWGKWGWPYGKEIKKSKTIFYFSRKPLIIN
jgi:hypothetical protein